jgi:metal-responsive CopG/Arc/MetJ family transcriptional regulator
MPSKGTTKRGIRIPDALWREFQAATREAGTNPSETIRQLIRDWTNTHKQRGSSAADYLDN